MTKLNSSRRFEMDVVWFWRGGSEVGQWHAADFAEGRVAELERMGFVALTGKRSIGAPEGPPSADRLAAVLGVR